MNTYSADFTQKRAVASVARAVGLNDLADKFEASFYVSYNGPDSYDQADPGLYRQLWEALEAMDDPALASRCDWDCLGIGWRSDAAKFVARVGGDTSLLPWGEDGI